MKYNVLNNHVCVELDAKDEKHSSGLFLAGSLDLDSGVVWGTVLGLDNCAENDDSVTIVVGDRVAFRKFEGTEIKLDGKTCYTVKREALVLHEPT
jgi:co-chaperonin GroES (HSP10)